MLFSVVDVLYGHRDPDLPASVQTSKETRNGLPIG
jgi:hypothetical protein